jgi:hypothetical protein
MTRDSRPAVELYTRGDYATRYPDYHLSESANKAADLRPALKVLLGVFKGRNLRIADVGAGPGGVLDEVVKVIAGLNPQITVEPVGYEISPEAVAIGAAKFPNIPLRQKFFEVSDGPVDLVTFVDVLEHVENPWELLRTARASSRYMIVRQPMLESFSTYRHSDYAGQRKTWGHISFFTHRFFLDMADATGWEPVKVDLVASWEMAGNPPGGVIHRLITRASRPMAAFFLSGFYLNGLFRAK